MNARSILTVAGAAAVLPAILLLALRVPANEWALYVFPPTRLIDFAVGILLGLAFLRPREGRQPSNPSTIEALALCAVVASIALVPKVPEALRLVRDFLAGLRICDLRFRRPTRRHLTDSFGAGLRAIGRSEFRFLSDASHRDSDSAFGGSGSADVRKDSDRIRGRARLEHFLILFRRTSVARAHQRGACQRLLLAPPIRAHRPFRERARLVDNY